MPIAYTKTPLALFEKRKASYKYSLSKPSSHRSYSGHRQKGPAPGYPRTGASLFIRKKLSFYFRLANRTHSVIRAYGRRTVPLAPTAFPTQANRKEFAFRSTGKATTEASENRSTKAQKEEIHPSHTTCWKNAADQTQKAPIPGTPRIGALLFIREKPSLLFRCPVHDYAIVTVQCFTAFWPGRVV